jgi:hypothetical protein
LTTSKIGGADLLNRLCRCFHIHGVPVGIQLHRGARRLAQQFFAAFRVGGQTDHQPLGCSDAVPAFALEELQFFALPGLISRDFAQGQFAQSSQIARLEEVLERLLESLGRINFPLSEALT